MGIVELIGDGSDCEDDDELEKGDLMDSGDSLLSCPGERGLSSGHGRPWVGE